MKKYIVQLISCCAACAALTATAQNPPGTRDASPGTPSDPSSTSNQWRNRLGATGRMGSQELRGSKLMGAEIKTSQSESVGKLEDILVNPMSGRIDFAIISYSGSSANATPTSPTSTTSTAGGEKLIPVPWSTLRPQSMTGYSTSPSSTTSATVGSTSDQQPTFVFTGDKSRLDNAPSFERSNWPDLTQSDWRQRISSHFGAATGGATTPGGTSSGTSTETPATPPSGTPDSPNSTPDSSNPTPK